MTKLLDLADIQGNILTAYGKMGFPHGRFLLVHVDKPQAGRTFVELLRRRVTTALRWPSDRKPNPPGKIYQRRPEVTINLAFTFWGLLALQVPIRTLRGLPDEFIDGMAARADILGDNFPHRIKASWDPVWNVDGGSDGAVHILVTLNAQMNADGSPVAALEDITREITALCDAMDDGVRLLHGHRSPDPRWQDLSALMEAQADGTKRPLPIEHFGFVDAIGDPVFEGQKPDEPHAAIGQGKLLGDQSWVPLATGEFLLGHPDESQEIAGASMPLDFSRNGTFVAYRKLHQNVAAWNASMATLAKRFAAVMEVPEPEAEETLKAKMAGRWRDGTTLIAAPDFAAWQAVREKRLAAEKAGDTVTLAALNRALVDFTFADDQSGAKCPIGAHLRRANTRDMLDPHLTSANKAERNGSVLNNRRRMLRRGLPYGAHNEGADDAGEHGIVLLATCANLFRQFEFVQQQWMQYGLDFNAGNDTCPIVGNHGAEAKFVIPADPASGKPPFFCGGLPQFVETRGGEYFFTPSMTALRMIATGVVDPT